MQQRFPTDSTQSITLHLTPPSSANGASNSLYKSDEAKVAKAPRSSAGRSTKSHSKSSGKVNGATGAITLGPDNDGDNFESLGDKHKRAWNDFHSENGVRTVVGEIAGVKNGAWRLEVRLVRLNLMSRLDSAHALEAGLPWSLHLSDVRRQEQPDPWHGEHADCALG